MQPERIKIFGKLDRIFHLLLVLTFLNQAATGFGRLFFTTAWGKKLVGVFGGYENALLLHKWGGFLMIAVFAAHVLYLITRIRWKNLGKLLFGPESVIPTHRDVLQFGQKVLWFFGLGTSPKIDRWAYWEKIAYWGVFWGLPLLALTGLMLMYPLATTRLAPGWILNVAALLHRAEALLAVAFIFAIHFFLGHLRPSNFPLNEAMFAGSIRMEKAMEEKPAWIERLKNEGKLELAMATPPARWFRVLYYVFGYAALALGVYLLINGIIYSRYIRLH